MSDEELVNKPVYGYVVQHKWSDTCMRETALNMSGFTECRWEEATIYDSPDAVDGIIFQLAHPDQWQCVPLTEKLFARMEELEG